MVVLLHPSPSLSLAGPSDGSLTIMPPTSVDVSASHHFDLASAHEIPDSHYWAPPGDEHPVSTETIHTLPVILLGLPDSALQAVRALESWGVFLLANHGLPDAVFHGLEAQARRLFTLPANQKMRAARSPGSISGYGRVPISSFFSKLMWSEGFTVSGPTLPHALELWPNDPEPFVAAVEEYSSEMRRLARHVVGLVMHGLGIVGSTEEMEGVLQLNWYPPCPEPARAIGMADHTDSGLVTILHQTSGSRGLQLLQARDDGPTRWVPVQPMKGALIVIAGDLLHVLSNGRLKNAVHRVMVNRGAARLSAAYFCGPGVGVTVGPDPRLVDRELGPRFRAVTWAEYRRIRGELFQGAIDSIRLSAADADADADADAVADADADADSDADADADGGRLENK